jgi:hypothetical protein
MRWNYHCGNAIMATATVITTVIIVVGIAITANILDT